MSSVEGESPVVQPTSVKAMTQTTRGEATRTAPSCRAPPGSAGTHRGDEEPNDHDGDSSVSPRGSELTVVQFDLDLVDGFLGVARRRSSSVMARRRRNSPSATTVIAPTPVQAQRRGRPSRVPLVKRSAQARGCRSRCATASARLRRQAHSLTAVVEVLLEKPFGAAELQLTPHGPHVEDRAQAGLRQVGHLGDEASGLWAAGRSSRP